ncbi:MAG: hypothetical protein M0Z53_02235 [Thermaerobacter sp.]|nr:hypothetical protein [Thermaerobacter sp.]
MLKQPTPRFRLSGLDGVWAALFDFLSPTAQAQEQGDFAYHRMRIAYPQYETSGAFSAVLNPLVCQGLWAPLRTFSPTSGRRNAGLKHAVGRFAPI